MRFSISGVGAWGAGVASASDIGSTDGALDEVKIPRPAVIPPRELRRSPAASRLAVEVASQACQAASQDSANMRSVFTSSLGDSDITDYMCRTLAGSEKLLSPTKFHNSVHNAAAGSWSIACENTAPTTFVAAFESSAGMALFEALSLVASDGAPTLLVAVDVPVPGALGNVHGQGTTAAIAMVIEPERADASSCDVRVEATEGPIVAEDPASVTGGYWSLVDAVARGRAWQGCMGLGVSSQLALDLHMSPTDH